MFDIKAKSYLKRANHALDLAKLSYDRDDDGILDTHEEDKQLFYRLIR